MWTQITPAVTALSPMAIVTSRCKWDTWWKTHELSHVTLYTAWGGNNVSSPRVTPADAFIRKHLDDAASTDNLHNCSHCLNHCDHQQASLDISLSPVSIIPDSDSDDLLMDSPVSLATGGGWCRWLWASATVGWLGIICYIFDWEPLIWSLYNQLWFITRHLKIKLRSGTSSNIYWMNQINCWF